MKCENCEKTIYNPMEKWIHILNDEEGCKHVGDYNKATPEQFSVCDNCEKKYYIEFIKQGGCILNMDIHDVKKAFMVLQINLTNNLNQN